MSNGSIKYQMLAEKRIFLENYFNKTRIQYPVLVPHKEKGLTVSQAASPLGKCNGVWLL